MADKPESTFSGYNGSHFFLRIVNGGTSKDKDTMKSYTTFNLYVGSYDGYSGSGAARSPSFSNGTVTFAASVSSIPARSNTHIGTTVVTVEHDANGNPKNNAYTAADISFPWNGLNYAWVDLTVNPGTITPPKPSYNSISATEITSSSVRLKASIDLKGKSITGGGWDITTDSTKQTWNYEAGDVTDKTLTGLQANTTYYYRGYCVTSAGGTNSSWASFTTAKPAKPTITSFEVTERDEDLITVHATASSSLQATISTIEFGRGTNELAPAIWYTATNGSYTFTNLSAATTYYIYVRAKDNFNTYSDNSMIEASTTHHKVIKVITPDGVKRTPAHISQGNTVDKYLDDQDIVVVD